MSVEFTRYVGLKDTSYPALHRWSVQQPSRFWSSLWDYCEVRGSKGDKTCSTRISCSSSPILLSYIAKQNYQKGFLRHRNDHLSIFNNYMQINPTAKTMPKYLYYSLPKDLRLHPFYRNKKKYLALLSISRLATKLPRIFPPGNTIYVFANIWNQPDYFKPLTQHYKIYRYYDFPLLCPFIDKQPPNTFMLFAIEKYIAKQAQKIFHVHWNEL